VERHDPRDCCRRILGKITNGVSHYSIAAHFMRYPQNIRVGGLRARGYTAVPSMVWEHHHALPQADPDSGKTPCEAEMVDLKDFRPAFIYVYLPSSG
jgi:hypothetical protein